MDYANQGQKRALRQFFRALSPEGDTWEKIVVKGDASILVNPARGGTDVFIVPRRLTTLVKQLPGASRWPGRGSIVAGGLHAGLLRGPRFTPTHALASVVFSSCRGVVNTATVGIKLERQVSYGRALPLAACEKIAQRARTPYYFVENEKSECLALGRLEGEVLEVVTTFGNYLKEDDPRVVL
ncbi:MAG: hypothetical protein ACTSU5_16310 [Promethearchaeota archaeon]